MSNVTGDIIVAKLWNLYNALKDDGVASHQYVTELIYRLFLKMAKETGGQDDEFASDRWLPWAITFRFNNGEFSEVTIENYHRG